jgi:hypothetical protein
MAVRVLRKRMSEAPPESRRLDSSSLRRDQQRKTLSTAQRSRQPRELSLFRTWPMWFSTCFPTWVESSDNRMPVSVLGQRLRNGDLGRQETGLA